MKSIQSEISLGFTRSRLEDLSLWELTKPAFRSDIVYYFVADRVDFDVAMRVTL